MSSPETAAGTRIRSPAMRSRSISPARDSTISGELFTTGGGIALQHLPNLLDRLLEDIDLEPGEPQDEVSPVEAGDIRPNFLRDQIAVVPEGGRGQSQLGRELLGCQTECLECLV